MTSSYAHGRRVNHDPRSLDHPAAVSSVRSVLWAHTAPVLDQGDLGSCTGNAITQLLNTTKFGHARNVGHHGTGWLTEVEAVRFYSAATMIDDVAGQYPPTDTGSSGLAVVKVGKSLGYFRAYTHAFGFDHFLAAVQLQPVIVGTTWYDSMYTPDSRGLVRIGGQPVGGHEYLVLGVDIVRQEVICLNSWGPDWGVKDLYGHGGRFRISFSDFKNLLRGYGDVTVPLSI
jgi:hypothetical protein